MTLGPGVAIVGVGATEQGDLGGRSPLEIAASALDLALRDAGLSKSAIDGLVVFGGRYASSFPDVDIASLCGLNANYSASLTYGTANYSLHLATMAIASGLADTVAIVYAAANRSVRQTFPTVVGIDDGAVHGFMNIAGPAAMAFRRLQHLYGVTEEQLGIVAVTQRNFAKMNPLAFQKADLTQQDYLSSPYLVRPLRRPDLCLVTDGAALILTAADRAGDTAKAPVHIRGIRQIGSFGGLQEPDHLLHPGLSGLRAIYDRSGVKQDDVGALYISEPASVWVLQMLEAMGFCGRGEAGPYLEDVGMGLGSRLPINSNGGHLAESYMLGFLQLVEAVRQLRGECGDRQIRDLDVVQFCSTGGFERGASTLLSRGAQG